jgi:hypothetical protein
MPRSYREGRGIENRPQVHSERNKPAHSEYCYGHQENILPLGVSEVRYSYPGLNFSMRKWCQKLKLDGLRCLIRFHYQLGYPNIVQRRVMPALVPNDHFYERPVVDKQGKTEERSRWTGAVLLAPT